MTNRQTLLKGSSVLLIALATGCAGVNPGGTSATNIAAGPSLNGSGLIANNAGGLISNNAGGLISNNAGGLISNNAGGLISNNAGGLISNNAGGLISNNAGGLTGTASGPAAGLISNNAGGLISNNAGGLISNNAGGLISNNAGGLISNNAGGYHVLNAGSNNSDLTPIAGARVAVFNERGEQVSYSWTTTDANGNWSFNRLKPSGPVLFVKVVYESEGQEVTLMATTPAPRKPGNVTADINPATTLVAKKVEEMVRLRAVNVASVQQSTVTKLVQAIAPALTPAGIVAAAILPEDTAAKTFDAMLQAAPTVAKALDNVAANAGLQTLVDTTPAQIQPQVPPVVTPPSATPTPGSSTAPSNGSTPTPTPSSSTGNTSSSSPVPTPTPSTTVVANVFTLGSVGNGNNLAANGGALYAPNGTSTDLANVTSLTSAAAFASDSNTPAGAKAVAFSGGTEYALVGNSIVGGGKTVTDASLGNGTAFVVVNGVAYVTDATDNCVFKADLSAGTVSDFAGTPNRQGGTGDGTGTAAFFKSPMGITYANGNLYVADSNNSEIRQISLAGEVKTFAGYWNVLPELRDGKGTDAHFANPQGITADAAGNLYVADTGNNAVRKIDASGNVTTISGNNNLSGDIDGKGLDASLNLPTSIAAGTVNGQQVLFVGEIGKKVRVLSGY